MTKMIRTSPFDLTRDQLDDPAGLSEEDFGLFGRMIEETYRWPDGTSRSASEALIYGIKTLEDGRTWIWFEIPWVDGIHDYLWTPSEARYDVQEFRSEGYEIKIGQTLRYRNGETRGIIEKIRAYHKNQNDSEVWLTSDTIPMPWFVVKIYLDEQL